MGRHAQTAARAWCSETSGEPAGFAKLGAPIMARAMRRANRRDLETLKHLLEARTG